MGACLTHELRASHSDATFDLGVAVKPRRVRTTRVIHDAKSVPFTTLYSVKHDTKYVWVGSIASVWPDHGDFRSTPVTDILQIGGHVSKGPIGSMTIYHLRLVSGLWVPDRIAVAAANYSLTKI